MMHANDIFEFNVGNFRLNTVVSGNGPIAIVIGSHKYYPRTFSNKLTKNLQLVCTDTRGFSLESSSHVEADFTLDKIIEDIGVIHQVVGGEKIIIVGHSIHAFIALEYARRFPNSVSHLVLIASSPIVGSELYKEADRYFDESVCPERRAAFEINMRKFMEKNDPSFVDRMLAFGPRLWYNHNFNASKLWDGVEINSIGAEIIWGRMFEKYKTAKAMKAIKCPIFLALGRYDYFNPPYLWEEYRKYASDFTMRIFEKSGHTPQFEESKSFDAELSKWLKI